MSAFSDLRRKLAELFQLDAAAELDFGIYRILNARRVEIEGFLDSLEPQVEAILAEALQTGTGELIAELEKVEAGLRAGGFDDAMISTAPKVKELRDKIASAGGDPTAITLEIFSLLTTFFGRYYKDGDFLSLRRYKKDTYAIPYEGEEVKLHWANADHRRRVSQTHVGGLRVIRMGPTAARHKDSLSHSPNGPLSSPMRDAVVRARVNPDLKADAERVFEALGINTKEAIRMFLSQVRLRGGLPFAVEVPKHEDLLVSSRMRQEALDSIEDAPGLLAPETQAAEWQETLEKY